MMFPVAETIHSLSLKPDDCPLVQSCRPPANLEGWRKVEDYLLFATSCALASCFESAGNTNQTLDGLEAGWRPTIQPHILRKRFGALGKTKQLVFAVRRSEGRNGREGILKCRTRWEWVGENGISQGREQTSKGEGKYEWVERIGGNQKEGWGDGEGEVIRQMREVVEDAGKE